MRKRRINMQRNSNLFDPPTRLATSPQTPKKPATKSKQDRKITKSHLHPLPQPQQSPKRPIDLHTRHLLLLPRPRSTRLRTHARPPQKHRRLLPGLPIAAGRLPEAQLDDDILHDGVGVQQHVDEGCWEVEQAVFEAGEEGDFCLGGGGGFAVGGGHFVEV